MGSSYEQKECIGFGTYGKVYRGIDETGQVVALKAVDLERVPEEIEDLQKEVYIMQQLNLPYVVEYHRSFIKGSVLWIIMEYMDGGSLDSVLRKGPKLSEEMCASILYDLLQGLIYLHAEGKIHRDLKCGNILVSSAGKVKLSDFGVAGQLTQTKQARNTLVGSPYWTAPEVISENNYNQKADMWSFGITAIEMATGRPPNSVMHPMDVLIKIPKMTPPRLDPSFSREFRDLVERCCQLNPDRRVPAAELVKHPFFEKRIQDPESRAEKFAELLNKEGTSKEPVDEPAGEEQPSGEIIAEQVAEEVAEEDETSRHVHFSKDSEPAEEIEVTVTLDELLAQATVLPEQQVKIIVKCLLNNLLALHSKDTMLKDPSTGSVKLSSREGAGLAWFSQEDGKVSRGDALFYTAPETIFENKHTRKSDVWSLGTIMYRMITGRAPFGAAKNPIATMNAIRKSGPLEVEEQLASEELRSLIARCTCWAAVDRPDVSELVSHEVWQLNFGLGSSLLSYELLEAEICRTWRALNPEAQMDATGLKFLEYTHVREDKGYHQLVSGIDFASGEGLDWETIDEEMPTVGEYLESEVFQQLLKRYQAVGQLDKAEQAEDPANIEWEF